MAPNSMRLLVTAFVITVAGTTAGAAGPPAPVTVMFAGDTDFAESYQEEFARAGEPNVLLTAGYDGTIGDVGRLSRRSDVVVVNLETPLTKLRKSPFVGAKTHVHYSCPDRAPAVLRAWGVDAVSLANNHTLDYGVPGLDDTLAALQKAGLTCFGAGRTADEALRPWVTDLAVGSSPVRLVVHGAFDYRRQYDERYRFYARSDRPGVNGCTEDDFREQMVALMADHPHAFVVAFPHWADNYHWRRDDQQRRARAAVDAGATLVIGHGAHRLQEIEYYRGRWVVYGLGNWVFNTKGRFAQDKQPPYGLVALLRFEPGPVVTATMRLYPILSDNRATGYRPRHLDGIEFARAADLLETRSRALQPNLPPLRRGHDEVGGYLEVDVGPVPIRR